MTKSSDTLIETPVEDSDDAEPKPMAVVPRPVGPVGSLLYAFDQEFYAIMRGTLVVGVGGFGMGYLAGVIFKLKMGPIWAGVYGLVGLLAAAAVFAIAMVSIFGAAKMVDSSLRAGLHTLFAESVDGDSKGALSFSEDATLQGGLGLSDEAGSLQMVDDQKSSPPSAVCGTKSEASKSSKS